jgi:hypothetical protein
VISARPLSEQDRELVTSWLLQDELHQQLGLKFEDVIADNSESYIISDSQGPIMAIRTQKALRVAMQFDPAHPYRTAVVAQEVIDWLKEKASAEKCTEIIIRPGGKAVKFAEKLKFLPFIGKYLEVK